MDTKAILQTLGKTPHWARLLIAVLGVQALFWLVIKPMVIGTPNPGFDTIAGYGYAEARIEAPTYAAANGASFEAIEDMPGWHCCEVGYRAFRYSFDLDEVPEKGLGIAPHVRTDNYAIYVNGSFVAGTGRMELPGQTFDAMIRKTHHVPTDVLEVGENEVTFILVREGVPYFDYQKPVLGEYAYIYDQLEKTNWLSDGYSYLVLAAVGMVALFALIFFMISGRDRDAFWLFVLAGAMAATTHYYIWTDPPFDGHTRMAYFFVISMLVPFAWFGWADSWSRNDHRWMLPTAALAFLAAVGAMLYSLYAMPYGPGYDRAGEILFYGGSVFAVATALRLVWNFRDLTEDRYLEAAIALLLISLFALQAITELTSALNMGYMTRTQPFLILGIALAFFARRVTLFRSSAQINALLQSQLDERTAELAASHEREKRFVRQQALDEERQRIMRDMHDGLGSHLMSMMMMAKRGAGKHSDFAEGIQSVIDEMRLLIDSMDSVGESLRSALTVFRKRIVPRAKDAGFTVTWNEADNVQYPPQSPRQVLQVFRILQEAITNALKHSGGDAITVDITQAGGAGSPVTIAIHDNGQGIEAESGKAKVSGRGLKNMRARAAGIGAEFDIASGEDGATVMLKLAAEQGREK